MSSSTSFRLERICPNVSARQMSSWCITHTKGAGSSHRLTDDDARDDGGDNKVHKKVVEEGEHSATHRGNDHVVVQPHHGVDHSVVQVQQEPVSQCSTTVICTVHATRAAGCPRPGWVSTSNDDRCAQHQQATLPGVVLKEVLEVRREGVHREQVQQDAHEGHGRNHLRMRCGWQVSRCSGWVRRARTCLKFFVADRNT
jgi:hypothetical protein